MVRFKSVVNPDSHFHNVYRQLKYVVQWLCIQMVLDALMANTIFIAIDKIFYIIGDISDFLFPFWITFRYVDVYVPDNNIGKVLFL